MYHKTKICLAAAVLSLSVVFSTEVQAVSYTAGEAQAEESKETEDNQINQNDMEAEENQAKEDRDETDNYHKSSDASLKNLDIQPGALSPSFSPDITEYTFVLEDNNMSQVLLNTETNSKNAQVIAVSGFTNLKIGENPAVLTVKAEDGTTKSYRVTVIRKQGEVEAERMQKADVSEEGYIETEQENLVVHSSFDEQLLPEGCTKVEYSYKGNYVEAAYFEEGELMLLYASDQNGNHGSFYVYYSGSNEFFEFCPIESSSGLIVFPVQYPTGIPIPNYFTEASIELNGKAIPGYTVSQSLMEEDEYSDLAVEEEESAYTMPEYTEYFLFFGISSEGNKGWYLYDTIENTCQRYLDMTADTDQNVFDEESYVVYKEKSQKRMVVICVLIFILLVFIGIILNQFLTIREFKKEYEEDDEDEEEQEEKEDEEEKVVEKKPVRSVQKPVVKQEEKKKVLKPEKEQKQETASKPKTVSRPEPKHQIPPDLDDDFEFEFIDIHR